MPKRKTKSRKTSTRKSPPLYVRVRDAILKRLASNEFSPGDVLPSEAALAKEYGVSQGTARKALLDLARRNLLVRKQGRGTRVATHTNERALFHFFHIAADDGARVLPDSLVVGFSQARANQTERDKLKLTANAAVIRIIRIRTMDGAPIISERISLPSTRFGDLAKIAPQDLPNTLYRHYETEFKQAIIKATERVKVAAADTQDARHLRVKVGHPLLEIDRVALGHGDVALEWRVSRCNTKRYHYLNELE